MLSLVSHSIWRIYHHRHFVRAERGGSAWPSGAQLGSERQRHGRPNRGCSLRSLLPPPPATASEQAREREREREREEEEE
uniref:Pco133201 n=1 Tax=Arundo donax TaxID=35708 RepID=A0A0A9FI95_ARUDO